MLRFALFFVVLLAVLGGLNALVHRRLSERFALSQRARRLFAGWLAAGVAAVVLGRLAGSVVGSLVTQVALLFELAVLVAGVLFAAEGALVWMVARLVRARASKGAAASLGERGEPALDGAVLAASDGAAALALEEGAPGPTAPLASAGEASPAVDVAVPYPGIAAEGDSRLPALSRRELLSRASAGAVMAVGGGTAAYGGLFGRHDYVVEEVPIALERLPRQLDGFTIAQLSDIHLGLFGGEPEMAAAVELARRARPDLVAITGDMVDHDPAYADALGRLVRRLGEVAPVVVVPGNHDHYAGVATVLDRVRRGGGEVLDNRHVRVGGGALVVAGVDDVWARRMKLGRGPDLDAALAGVPDDLPRVLLAHQPVFFEESAARVDLQLSGHTHGGQFTLGIPFAEHVLPHGWVAGRYRRGQAQLYVNRGFGTAGPPARLGAPPEVTRLVLTV